jgi:hypothetical protein
MPFGYGRGLALNDGLNNRAADHGVGVRCSVRFARHLQGAGRSTEAFAPRTFRREADVPTTDNELQSTRCSLIRIAGNNNAGNQSSS